jgi:hypothetical protein
MKKKILKNYSQMTVIMDCQINNISVLEKGIQDRTMVVRTKERHVFI